MTIATARQGRGARRTRAGGVIGVSALLVGAQGVDRLLHPQPLGAPLLGIVVIVVSLG
ncbi:hypothetical protein SSTU70S_00258 [Stutzerimonas stutzeri]